VTKEQLVGSKSYASLKRSVTFIIRKDGVECKYICYKGEELIDYDLLYEIETEEENGVIFEMPLNNYSEYNEYISKAKQKLAYYDTVVLIINGNIWDNKIYRNELFQFSTTPSYKNIHLCVKDVVYEIDYDKLKISPIPIPIALRFSLTDGIIPTPSRESYLNSRETLELIKRRIEEVSEYLVEKYNETVSEPTTLYYAYSEIGQYNKYLKLQDVTWDISCLAKYSSVPFKEIQLKDTSLRNPSYYRTNIYTLMESFILKSEYTYGGQMRAPSRYENSLNLFSRQKKIVLLNYVKGNFREFLKDKYSVGTHFGVHIKRDLVWYRRNILGSIPRKDWRAYIKEWQTVEESIIKDFCDDQKGLEDSKEFTEWIENKKEFRKKDRIANPSNYKILNKQNGEVTIAFPRDSVKGYTKVFEKATYKIEDLRKEKQIIVFTETEKEEAIKLASIVVKQRVAIIGIREYNKVKHLVQFKTYKEFMEDNKAFRRIVTAIKANKIYRQFEEILKHDIAKKCLLNICKEAEEINEYVDENFINNEPDYQNALLEVAKEHNLWDEEMLWKINKMEKNMATFDFIPYLRTPSYWDTDNLKQVNRLINQLLLFRKKKYNELENYELTLKELETVN